MELPDPKYNLGKFASQPYFKSQGTVHIHSRSNFAFALEKSWPYFLYHNSNLGSFLPGKGKFSDLQSLIGKEYVEGYFLHTLLSNLNKTGYRWIGPTEKYMPDGCYVINESTVVCLNLNHRHFITM